jgi:hypothetical protein
VEPSPPLLNWTLMPFDWAGRFCRMSPTLTDPAGSVELFSVDDRDRRGRRGLLALDRGAGDDDDLALLALTGGELSFRLSDDVGIGRTGRVGRR